MSERKVTVVSATWLPSEYAQSSVRKKIAFSFFASTASRRAAIEAGRTDVVRAREADDLLRDAEAFHHLVESSLGLPYQQVLPLTLPSCD